MTDAIECVVIGAGVVGLAVGRALARAGIETVILEAEHTFGTHTSSRNSEVIHAGIYYATDSLKARFCVEGRRMLYAFCDSHMVSYKKYGKVICATDPATMDRLEEIYRQGQINGVEGLKMLSPAETQAKTPGIHTVGAIWSPETGVVDSHQLMMSLLGDFEAAGGSVAYKAPILSGHKGSRGHRLKVGGAAATELDAKWVINCAGLKATQVAHQFESMPGEQIPIPRYAKGAYFSYAGKTDFEHLIYPLPFVGGLGIHLTLDTAGAAKFGPDVEWFDDVPDYKVDEASKPKFIEAVQDYWPGMDPDKLIPAYSGIRPKMRWPDRMEEDFVISTPKEHGVNGLLHLFGFESPGLTSCLAIGEHVKKLVL